MKHVGLRGDPKDVASQEQVPALPTKATFLDHMLSVSPLLYIEDFRFYEGVGWAMQVASQVGSGLSGTVLVSGAGAGATPNATRTILLSTGSTAAGNSRYVLASLILNPDWLDRRLFPTVATAEASLFFTCRAYVLSLGTSVENFTFLVTFGGNPVDATLANIGVRIEYNYAVNSGNWVIKYPKSDGSIGTINTSVPVGTNGTLDAAKVTVRAVRPAGGTSSEVTVTFGTTSPVTYTITDSSFHTSGGQIGANFGARMDKIAGTTSRIGSVQWPIMGATFG